MLHPVRLLKTLSPLFVLLLMIASACNPGLSKFTTQKKLQMLPAGGYLSKPLVTHIYTADPAAHIFRHQIYIYPSHDTNSNKTGANGDHYDMVDYHVLSMKTVNGPVIDHGVALSLAAIPWARRQLWAPDAAFTNGLYYLFFPAKDAQDIFRIGVAISKNPEGPFVPEQQPIAGSYSIDPAVFKDKDGRYYLYFGGIGGGQLQRWDQNEYHPDAPPAQGEELAILPRVALLAPDMKSFSTPVHTLEILDSSGHPFKESDHEKRFFEGAWMHHYNGKYYFSYSTGDTHKICYAIGSNPYGPFVYAGVLLNPVQGWTTHHSIIRKGKHWYLFYHDVQLSGKNHLRNIKMTSIHYHPDGTMETITPYRKS